MKEALARTTLRNGPATPCFARFSRNLERCIDARGGTRVAEWQRVKTSAPLLFFVLSFLFVSLAAALAGPTLGCATAADESAFGEARAEGGLGDSGPDALATFDDAALAPDPPTTAADPSTPTAETE